MIFLLKNILCVGIYINIGKKKFLPLFLQAIRISVSTNIVNTFLSKSANQALHNWGTHVVTRPRAVETGKPGEVEEDERRSCEWSVAGAYSLYTSTGQQIPGGLRRMRARSRTWPTRTKPINFPFNSLDPSSAPSRLPIIVLQFAQRHIQFYASCVVFR